MSIEKISYSSASEPWQPVSGYEAEAVLQGVPIDSRDTVRSEALAVLRKCGSPDATMSARTGLVIGYVQSGKTLSFTAVAALARDNGFRLIIVLTGTSVYLYGQSLHRLSTDLRLDDGIGWKHYSSTEFRDQDSRGIQYALKRWNLNLPDEEKQTVILTVMKEKTHLKGLVALLGSLDLNGVPTLIIDDEADQAGLNTRVKKRQESALYSLLRQVRNKIPQHTFLQYTATPQALLLINIIDTLSPDFAEVLTPGAAYTGGKVFFEANLQLVREIPATDVPSPANILSSPPASLLAALRLYFVGVAVGMLTGGRRDHGNRSMMIHPSRLTPEHGNYNLWIATTRKRWERIFAKPVETAEFSAELKLFRVAYEDLQVTASTLPAFEDVLAMLPMALGETRVHVVNRTPLAGKRPGQGINWKRDYSHILIGGQALDRGFTVQGLTVTYMPRGLGVANADTIQQRARWFGYKEKYLGFCRVFLTLDTTIAYKAYVEHEEHVRALLRNHATTSEPLQAWKRAFFLASALKPTRSNVLSLDYMRGNFGAKWYETSRPHADHAAADANLKVIKSFQERYDWERDMIAPAHPDRLPSQRHLVVKGICLSELLTELLVQLRISDVSDSRKFIALLLTLEAINEKWELGEFPEPLCDVFLMRPDADWPRYRSVDPKLDTIKNLFQGAYPDATGSIYRGDRAIRSNDRLTVQIHILDQIRTDKAIVATSVPALAVWVPKNWGADWLA